MAEIRLSSGGARVGFADLSPEQQQSLLDCGAIVLAGREESIERIPPNESL
jgi:hypothetical protein